MSHLNSMMEQVKKLKNGIGVQRLIDEASKILGNPLLVFNTEYELLAHTEVITDDAFWNELVTQGTFGKESQQLFVDEGFVEEVANSRIALLRSENRYDRISGKLYNKNNSFVSNLLIVACNKPFGENDQMVFEIICKLLTKEISKNEFFQEYEQTHQESIIKNLLDGNYDIKQDIAQVSILYDSLGPSLYIAVLDISFCNIENSNTDYFIKLLRTSMPRFKYATYSGYILMIISTNNDTLDVGNELRHLIKFLEQNNIYAGISGRFENLFDLNKYYSDAQKSLSYLLENKCSKRIFPYNINSLKTMQQINALLSGEGIQYFLNKGPEIFGNPLLFHDMELNLLGYTENVKIIDPIWEELITYGTSSDETIELFKTEGFVSTMENTKGGALLVSEKIKYDRISWKIYNYDNIMIGCLSIVNSDKQFSEDELVLFGAFSQKFSSEVVKNDFYINYGQVYSATVINRLISGKIDDYTFYSEDIGNLYNNLMNNLYLVVIDAKQSGAELKNLAFIRDLLNNMGTVNRYAIYLNHIIILISLENVSVNELKELNKISKLFEQHNIYAGISGCFENIYDLQKHYLEAVSALNNGMKELPGKKRIFKYNETADSP